MRTLFAVTVLFLCCCAGSRAEQLRERYRAQALDADTADACRRDPSACPGYGQTFWRMPRAEVERVTGCTVDGFECVKSVTSKGGPLDERYVFRRGALSAVTIDFPEFGAALERLCAALGAPGWQGNNTDLIDDRIDDAESSEIRALLLGTTYLAMRAHEDKRDLEKTRRRTTPMRCASWNRELTRVLLCEVGRLSTTAVFTSRLEPDTTLLSDWQAPP